MAKAVRYVFLLVLIVVLASCSGKIRRDFGGGGGKGGAQVMIVQDRPAVELSMWDGAIVFDLRDYEAWAQGHIPGARHVTLEDIRHDRALPEDLNAPVLFMGDGPMDSLAELAADAALKLGHTNVQLFPGGWRSWTGDKPIDN